MASSSYWYGLYKDECKKIKAYEKQIEELRKVLNYLQDNLWDEIRNVNNEIDELKADLNKSIRHNSRFTTRANALESEKEKAASADPNLRTSMNEIDNEISRLNSLKEAAIKRRDEYYRRYEAAKEEERQARLKALKEIFS